MTTSGRHWVVKLWSASLSALAFGIAYSGDCARTQIVPDDTLDIVPDDTLDEDSSVVRPLVNSDQIDGGAIRGTNLFHSFREFNVDEGRGAYFTNPAGIENILSRVTGENPSNILGTLGISNEGNANLFLINPNGIIFGLNASLDVNGSFVATTANAIQFGDDYSFSASARDVPPVLTVNPSAFFFNQTAAGAITNQSRTGLLVPAGQNLLLLGGDVRLEGGRLTALSSRVELGGLAGAGTVGLNVNASNNVSLSFPMDVQRADVSLTNEAEINVAGSGGSIAIAARNIDILGKSSLRAGIPPFSIAVDAQAGDIEISATGAITIANSSIYNAVFANGGNGGNLNIDTRQLIIRDGVVATATISKGDAGDLTVNASELVELTGTSADGTVPINIARIPTSINVPIGLFAASISIQDLIEPTAPIPFAVPRTGGGDAGNLTINTGRLIAQGGATVSASTTTQGQGGKLTVNASESIKLSGTSASGSPSGGLTIENVIPSGLRNETRGRGPGNDLTITTGQLIIQDGAWVTAGTAGKEPGGNLTVNAEDSVEVIGTSSANGIPSVLATGTQAVGDSRDLTINARRLIVRDGAVVSAGTSSDGQGGSLTVKALDSVELIGTAAAPVVSVSAYEALLGDSGVSLLGVVAGRRVPSGLITGTAGKGNAGHLTIETGRLVIRDGAQASVSTTGAGNAGALTVRAPVVELTGTSADVQPSSDLIGRSLLTTAVSEQATGKGGDLTIETGQLTVQDGAAVAVSSLNPASELGAGDIRITAQSIRLDNIGKLTAQTASGDGGDITLEARDLLLLRHNSQISSTAGTDQTQGDGGNITIKTPFIVAVPSENSDIKANAFLGQGGKVTIDASVFGLTVRNLKDLQTLLQAKEPTKLDPINLLSSDITAISQTNPSLSGEVTINSPDVDPSRGLAILPAEPVDVTGLIAQTCPAGGGQGQSEFTVTGRGGLPENPSDSLSSDAVEVDLVTLNPKVENRSSPTVSTNSTSPTPAPIVEAQGWVINDKGEVVLTANAPTVTPSIPWLTPSECRAPQTSS